MGEWVEKFILALTFVLFSTSLALVVLLSWRRKKVNMNNDSKPQSHQSTLPEEGNNDVDGGSTCDQGGHPHHQAGVVCVAHWHGYLKSFSLKKFYIWSTAAVSL